MQASDTKFAMIHLDALGAGKHTKTLFLRLEKRLENT
jgi:hypothetical protein